MSTRKDEIEDPIAWLRERKKYLNISAIGEDAGTPHLRNYVNDTTDGRGYRQRITEARVERLRRLLAEIRSEDVELKGGGDVD